MQELGKALFLLGCVLVVVGGILWKSGSLGWLGKLPGDIFVEGKSSTFYFPIVTCLVVSVVLTLIGWLFRR